MIKLARHRSGRALNFIIKRVLIYRTSLQFARINPPPLQKRNHSDSFIPFTNECVPILSAGLKRTFDISRYGQPLCRPAPPPTLKIFFSFSALLLFCIGYKHFSRGIRIDARRAIATMRRKLVIVSIDRCRIIDIAPLDACPASSFHFRPVVPSTFLFNFNTRLFSSRPPSPFLSFLRCRITSVLLRLVFLISLFIFIATRFLRVFFQLFRDTVGKVICADD